MDTKKLFFFWVGVKCAVLLICFSFIGVSYVIGQIWLKPLASISDVEDTIDDELSGRFGQKFDINSYNEYGLTGLMHAIFRGRIDLFNLLLAKGASVNMLSRDGDNDTALHKAIIYGNSKFGFEYTDSGGQKQKGFIPLLLEHGADIHVKNNRGNTPAHLFFWIDDYKKQKDVVNILLDHEDKPHIQDKVKTERAVKKRLMNMGEDSDEQSDRQHLLNIKNEHGDTLLHLIASSVHAVLLEDLIKGPHAYKIDLSIKNREGFTPENIPGANANISDLFVEWKKSQR